MKKFELLPQGSTKKDLLLPFFIIVATVLIAWDYVRVLEAGRMDSLLINIAGRQRMLNQRLGRGLFQEKEKNNTEDLTKTAETLLTSINVLKNGGVIEINNNSYTVPRSPSNDSVGIASHTQEQEKLIRSLIELIKTNGLPNYDLEKFFKLSDELSKNTEQTVQLYMQESSGRIQDVLARSILLIAAFCLAGLWLARLQAEKKAKLIELNAARVAAVHASEAKSIFLANMSHEIRTPLNAIIGMADLLSVTELSTQQKRYIETFKRASDTLLALVDDILDLSKIESGQMHLNMVQFNIHELVDQMGDIMALKSHQKGLELVCQVSADVPGILIGDSNRLREVLMNLLGNAIKFTTSGEVVLRVNLNKIENNEVALDFNVVDTGAGIAESRFKKIFENFTQADATIASDYGGTGLGLSICKKLVELMGGQIDVKSRLGTGSTFHFMIKLRLPEKSDVSTERAATFAGKKILIVDDNDTNRMLLREYLVPAGVLVHEVSSGKHAVDELRRKKDHYDLILLDYRMPGMNGIDVINIVQREKLATNSIVLLLTSDGKRSIFDEISNSDAISYMLKPIKKNELFAVMNRFFLQSGKIPDARAPLGYEQDKNGKKYRVLIVDDVEDNRFLLSSHLQKIGFMCDEAVNGKEALDKFKDGSYDLVFMDMRMTVMDGHEATRALRDFEVLTGGKPVPVIAVTALATKEDVEKCFQSGCTGFIAKPITRLKLFDEIARVFSGFKQEMNAIQVESEKVEPFMKDRLARYVMAKNNEIAMLLQEQNPREAVLDLEALGRVGHNIAGTAAMYGISALGALAQTLEQACGRNDADEARRLCGQMQKVLGTFLSSAGS